MSKYSYEFELKVIKYYLEEHYSYNEYCEKFDVPDKAQIQQWVNKVCTLKDVVEQEKVIVVIII